jgi:hypothetical protein
MPTELSDTTPGVSVARDLSNTIEKSYETPNRAGTIPPATPESIGLVRASKCTDAASLATVITPLVIEKFKIGDDKADALKSEISKYFTKCGVTNDNTYAYMHNADWPKVTTVEEPLSLISHPVSVLIKELAVYVDLALNSEYYLGEGVSYKSLSSWAKAKLNPVINDARGSSASETLIDTKKVSSKVPLFKVPTFTGDEYDGESYIRSVESAFQSAAMKQFLSDSVYCVANEEWSGAFCSRIRESLRKNTTVGFLAEENDASLNCASLWTKIKDHLNSSSLATAKVTRQWESLFGLKCESMSEFLKFYSAFKTIRYKLQTSKSVAITDDNFLRSFLARTIDVPELQEETKKFLKEPNTPYSVILEKIHKDYRAQDTTSEIKEKVKVSKSLIGRRAEKTAGRTASKFPRLPTNNKTMSNAAWQKLLEWHKIAGNKDRTDAEFEKANTMSFPKSEPYAGKKGGNYDKKNPNKGKDSHKYAHKKEGGYKKSNYRDSRRGRRGSSSRSSSIGRYDTRPVRSRSRSPRRDHRSGSRRRSKSRDRSPPDRRNRRASRRSYSRSRSPERNRTSNTRPNNDRRTMFGSSTK